MGKHEVSSNGDGALLHSTPQCTTSDERPSMTVKGRELNEKLASRGEAEGVDESRAVRPQAKARSLSLSLAVHTSCKPTVGRGLSRTGNLPQRG